MTLRTSSRYTTSVDQKTGAVIAVRKQQRTVAFETHVARDGDSFESLAQKVFGDPQQYWRIADINPQVKFPNELPVGTLIRIPK
jgi:nucleoid-associated protein YgaU